MAAQQNLVTITGSRGTYKFKEDQVNQAGKGAFGVVFKGYDIKNSSRILAIKRTKMPESKEEAELTKKELKVSIDVMLSGCLNLVDIKDFHASDNFVYTIMEYCESGDLAGYLKKLENHRMEEPVLHRLAIHLAVAMEALFNKNIIHRDLKPANILITKNDSKPYPRNLTFKVGDFGISRHLDVQSLATTIIGTPIYLAPEVILRKPYDNKCDLWSIGVILYECLTGKYPFNTLDLMGMVAAGQANRLPPQIPKISSKEFPVLADLLNKLLRSDVKERISVNDFFKHEYIATVEFVAKILARQTLKRVKHMTLTDSALKLSGANFN